MSIALLELACQSRRPHRADPAAFALAPATAPPPKVEAAAPSRPSSVLVWARVDQPDVLLDVFGLSTVASPSAGPYLELLDIRQPMDAVLVSESGRLRDVEPVFRVHFKEARAFFSRLSTAHELREDGDRVFGRPKGGQDEPPAADAWECVFTGGSDSAVCGGPHAVEAVAEWLRAAPAPPPAEASSPAARIFVFSEPLRLIAAQLVDAGAKPGGHTAGEIDKFFSDVERFDLELVVEGERLDLLGTLRLHSQQSPPAQDLLAPPNALATIPEAFHRVAQQSSVALFTPGGGAIPKWAADVVRQSQPASSSSTFPDPRPDQASVLGSLMGRPAVIGYGLRVDRARKALATARVSKDTAGSTRLLDDALEPQFVYALTAPFADVERAVRGLAASSPSPSPLSVGGPPRRSVRVAGARHGLARGSFFLDERTIEISSPGTSGTTRLGHTLFAADSGVVWGVGCTTEDACVETMKRLMDKTPGPRADDELFHQPGIVAAGFVPSFVGVSPNSRLLLRAVGATPSRLDVLTSIEHELRAPRATLPFVIKTTREGSGGTLSVRIRGMRNAFHTAFDRGVIGSSWVLARVVAMLFGK